MKVQELLALLEPGDYMALFRVTRSDIREHRQRREVVAIGATYWDIGCGPLKFTGKRLNNPYERS